MRILPLFILLTVPVYGSPALPEAIRTTLDSEYPGWKLAPFSAAVAKAYASKKITQSPALASGDLDQDGAADYGLEIVLTTPGEEEQIVMVFMARGDHFEENIVESMGPDPNVYLWIANKGTLDGIGKLRDRSIFMVLGSATGDVSYVFDAGRISEIPSPDDPEHPDKKIPRVPPVTLENP